MDLEDLHFPSHLSPVYYFTKTYFLSHHSHALSQSPFQVSSAGHQLVKRPSEHYREVSAVGAKLPPSV